jgi:hypothetical protein
LSIGNITITSSDFVLRTANNVLNFGGTDIFRADANLHGHNSMGGEFFVNGTETDGAAVIQLNASDQLLFMNDAHAHFVPTPAQLLHVDFVTGYLADNTAPGGQNVNVIEFRGFVPEPCAILLVAQSLCVLGRRRRST